MTGFTHRSGVGLGSHPWILRRSCGNPPLTSRWRPRPYLSPYVADSASPALRSDLPTMCSVWNAPRPRGSIPPKALRPFSLLVSVNPVPETHGGTPRGSLKWHRAWQGWTSPLTSIRDARVLAATSGAGSGESFPPRQWAGPAIGPPHVRFSMSSKDMPLVSGKNKETTTK